MFERLSDFKYTLRKTSALEAIFSYNAGWWLIAWLIVYPTKFIFLTYYESFLAAISQHKAKRCFFRKPNFTMLVKSVLMIPGASPFTRTPSEASSWDNTRINPNSAVFETEYAPIF